MTAEIRVARVSDLADGQRAMVQVDGHDVFVFERGGRYYAFENVCRHMGGPVGEGILMGKVEAVLDDEQRLLHERFSTSEIHLVCPWHGWEYDIETGECAANRRIRLRRYEAVQRGEDVYVIA
jgi:nitrite reductase/ring-hydroxylating ferredoxin subunit